MRNINTNYKYDYLIVGAGITGATIANILNNNGYKVLVIDKKNHLGGMAHTSVINGIKVHTYGPHIFHTNSENVWQFINKFGSFNSYVHQPIVKASNCRIYNLPFNMNMFSKVYDEYRPYVVRKIIDKELASIRKDTWGNLSNFRNKAISLVGPTIYYLFIHYYTEKQWLKSVDELSPDIITRIPLRFTYDNNYFNAKYQGIPIDGYTSIIENMLHGVEVIKNADYLSAKDYFNNKANKIIYTGAIDEYYNYRFGELEYISRDFKIYDIPVSNYYGASVINFADRDTPYIRETEHKHFDANNDNSDNYTVITRETSIKFDKNNNALDRCYPVNTVDNTNRYLKYKDMSKSDNIIFCGRLGDYRYYDMDGAISRAIEITKNLVNRGE